MGEHKILRPDKFAPNHAPAEKVLRDDCCSNCFFAEFPSLNVEQGACHEGPPQVVAVPQQDLAGRMVIGIQAFFRPVNRDTWCGRFEPAIDGDVDLKDL